MPPRSVELVRHPATPRSEIRGIHVLVERSSPDALDVRFRLEGATSRLAIPEPRPPRIVDGLWKHTCFEAFVANEDSRAYREFNLSPSGEWAAHAFRRYRDGRLLDDETLAPRIACEVGGDHLEVAARLAVDASAALRVGLAAVVEAADGALSYWALRHPSPRPDFHHREGFALRMEAAA